MQGWIVLRLCALTVATGIALAATPAVANADDVNLALPENGGQVVVSSEQGAYPSSAINNGERDGGAARGWGGYWNDATNGVWPDWAQVAWTSPQTLSRLVVRIPIGTPGLPVGTRTLRRVRIQYWDESGSRWADVVDARGAPNPVLDWESATVADPGQTRRFTFASPVTTSKVRVVIEDGSSDGWSWLDEIEAYGAGCVIPDPDPNPNLALASNGGQVSVSSELSSSFPGTAINDVLRQGGSAYGYWVDGTIWIYPDWAQIAWDAPQSIGRVVVRLPVGSSAPEGYRTIRKSRVQYWDDSGSSWIDVPSTRDAPNPILNWESSTVADASQVRSFSFTPVTTSKVRLLVEQGSDDGWSWLDEIEAYAR